MGLINLWLACFNLLPIPPLDGSSVVERLLPNAVVGPVPAIRPYTLLIVLGVVIIGQTSGRVQPRLQRDREPLVQRHGLRLSRPGYGASEPHRRRPPGRT